MTYIILISLIVCIIFASALMIKKSQPISVVDANAATARANAYRILQTDRRLAQLVMLLSYADMTSTDHKGASLKSNRRLILEVRQITRSHMMGSSTYDVNLVAAQLLIISRNIGKKRKEKNANMPVSKCK